MFSFHAYFWNNDVYINEKFRYTAGEILTAYLNTDYLSLAKELRYDLQSLKNILLFSEDMSYDFIQNYNGNVYLAMKKIRDIDCILGRLPPYNKLQQFYTITLEDILNGHTLLFEDGIDYTNEERPEEDTVNEFGVAERNENGNYQMHLHTYLPEEIDYTNYDMVECVEEANRDIAQYFDSYLAFLDSYTSVHKVFRPFIEHYLNRGEAFPNANEVASYFETFNQENRNAFQKISCKMESFGYKVLKDENNKSILCEEILFSDLQSFLFYDFFNGIKKNFIPNQCKQCGRFFLIHSGKYFNYCDTPLPNEPDKTCRDVGARRRYDDKCKNDPIWQTYNRAYKAHYARYMKKKMTISEFEKWSRFASELRYKALAKKIGFEQYFADIKK